jgi:hypothetical protein
MQPIQNQTRTFATRSTAHHSRWTFLAHTGLVIAAFVFVGAVTLGILA